jgi:hypothetical protein
LTLPGLELRPLGRPACSQSLYRLRYPISRWHNVFLSKTELKKSGGVICFFQTLNLVISQINLVFASCRASTFIYQVNVNYYWRFAQHACRKVMGVVTSIN